MAISLIFKRLKPFQLKRLQNKVRKFLLTEILGKLKLLSTSKLRRKSQQCLNITAILTGAMKMKEQHNKLQNKASVILSKAWVSRRRLAKSKLRHKLNSLRSRIKSKLCLLSPV
ncbi:hypothetical protein BCEN4_740139 [Burkholderia cenocepacia]|nr:hypothetical protein BCEN4_740139 [Burkholderia cenocepacia]